MVDPHRLRTQLGKSRGHQRGTLLAVSGELRVRLRGGSHGRRHARPASVLGFGSQPSCSPHLPSSPPPLRSGARPPSHARVRLAAKLLASPPELAAAASQRRSPTSHARVRLAAKLLTSPPELAAAASQRRSPSFRLARENIPPSGCRAAPRRDVLRFPAGRVRPARRMVDEPGGESLRRVARYCASVVR